MAFTSIFSSELGQAVLAFLLVFTLVFAVLQKAKILGEGKRQVDALISLAIALIVISVGSALDFIQKIIPFMAIILVVLLVLMILWGMLFKEGEFKIDTWVKIALGVIIFVIVIIFILMFTGGWEYIKGWFGDNSNWSANIVLVVIIIAAIVAAYFGGGEKPAKS